MKEFVIISLQKGIWYYLTTIILEPPRAWHEDLYMAKLFDSETTAIETLARGFEENHWGGYFKIEEVYVKGK